MSNIFSSLVEIQEFGPNPTTIVAGIILTITLFQGWGLYGQAQAIKEKKTGDGLSVLWLSYTGWFFATAILYAFYQRSGTMFVNASVMLVGNLWLLRLIWRFDGWTRNEKVQTALYALMPIVFVLVPSTLIELPVVPFLNIMIPPMPGKDLAFVAFSFGTICYVATQPWVMLRKKSAGVVQAKLVTVHLISVSFWAVYGFSIGAVALMILNPTLFVLFSLTLVLWFCYRKPG